MPELILTVLAVVLLWRICFPPSAAQLAARHGLWTLANLSNFFVWRDLGGYWGESAEMAPLLHTWSLAVEEQFYLFFPAFLLLLTRLPRRFVTPALLLTSAFSLSVCVLSTPHHPDAAFYMLPTRLWELLLGAALASADKLPILASPARVEIAGWFGLVLMLAGFVGISPAGFPGYSALVPIASTLLVILSARAPTRVAALLSTPALVHTGKLSYAVYLWHWPLIILGRFEAELHGFPALSGAIFGGALSIVIASAAYSFVEQPLRSRAPGRSRRLAVISAGFAAAVALSACVAAFTKPLETVRYFDMPAFYGRLYSTGLVSNHLASAARFRDVFFPPLTGRTDNEWLSGGILHPYGGNAPAVVVLGSSHATMYAKTIDDICRDLHQSVAFLSVDGAPIFFTIAPSESFPTPADCDRFNQARLRYLETWRPRAVFLIERWDTYAPTRSEFQAWLQPLLHQIAPLARNIYFVAQPPVIAQIGNEFNLREWAVWRARDGALPILFPDSNQSKRNLAAALAQDAAVEFPTLHVLRPDHAFLQPDGAIRWRHGRTVYYADDDHLSQAGAELVRGIFQDAISSTITQEAAHQ